MSEPIPAVTVTESGSGPYGQIVTAGHHVLGADEPERLGGQDTGLAPYELLLASLGACTSMTLRMYAERHDWKLTRISVALRHVRRPASESAGPLDRFERVITLLGELDESQRTRLLEIAEKCPVSQTLSRASLVVSSLA
jgi:putative redox protein